jgi:hypothetical protein
MAVGDLTASAPALVDASDPAALKVAIDALNLAAVTDTLWIVPTGHGKQVAVFKVERAAS